MPGPAINTFLIRPPPSPVPEPSTDPNVHRNESTAVQIHYVDLVMHGDMTLDTQDMHCSGLERP
jgi:hypothetical protein